MQQRMGTAPRNTLERPVKHPVRRPVRKRRSSPWLLRLCLGLFLVAALVAGTGIGYVYFGSSTVRQMVYDWRTGMWEPAKAFPGKSEVTVMFLGRDVDLDNRAQVVQTNGRTDTIMLVHLDFAAHTANMLSILVIRSSVSPVTEANTKSTRRMPSEGLTSQRRQ